MKTIKSLEELKDLAGVNGIEVYIRLNFSLKSTKFIEYDLITNTWYIENYIDGSTTTKIDDTNIKEAIRKGALYIS